MTNLRYLPLLLCVGALFGSSFAFVKVATPDFGPLPLMALRMFGAVALLALWARATRRRLRFPGGVRPWLVLGAVDAALPFSLMAWSVLRISSSLAAILMATRPLFTAAISSIWLRERLGRSAVGGALLGLLGVAVLSGGEATRGSALGVAAVLAASASYAFGNVYAKRRLATVDPLSLTTGTFAAAGLLLAPGAVATAPGRLPGVPATLAWAALTVLCSVLAFTLYFRLLARTTTVTASAIAFLIPAFGTLAGTVGLGEPFTPAMGAGFAAILASLALVVRPGRRPAPDADPRAPRRRAHPPEEATALS